MTLLQALERIYAEMERTGAATVGEVFETDWLETLRHYQRKRRYRNDPEMQALILDVIGFPGGEKAARKFVKANPL